MQTQKGYTKKVLDHGYIKLINYMGDDEEIVEAARMSTGRGFVSWDQYSRCKVCDLVTIIGVSGRLCTHQDWQHFPRGDIGFMEYLYSHKHMTPFEMPDMVVEFKAPIMVIWELVRHRTMSFNIESGRYSQLANEHYLPELIRFAKQSSTNKQDSSLEIFDHSEARVIRDLLEAEQESIYKNYDNFVEQGLVKELARLNAPMSRYSRGRAKANLRNWLAFLLLRKQTQHSKPQWEIAQFADAIGEIIKSLYPRTYELFEEYTLYSETFSRSEMTALRALVRQIESHGVNLKDAGPLGLSKSKHGDFLRKLRG